jgi:hypothetical protein
MGIIIPMKKVLGYKVRHTKTKMYLSSLSRGKWTKVGKTWPRKGDVVRSINNGLKRLKGRREYDSVLEDIPLWEIVELEEASSYSALFLLDKLKT